MKPITNRIFLTLFATAVVAAASMTSVVRAQEEAPAAAPGSITFVGKNMVATANGTFHKWHFKQADLNLEDPSASVVEIEVDVASIDTKIVKRDDHLRTADFFDVATYPTATLKIYEVAAAGESEAGNPQYSAKLDWNMHGVQKTYEGFTFEVTATEPIQVKGAFTIDRNDFKIGEPHKSLNPMSIQNEIPIEFQATLPAAE